MHSLVLAAAAAPSTGPSTGKVSLSSILKSGDSLAPTPHRGGCMDRLPHHQATPLSSPRDCFHFGHGREPRANEASPLLQALPEDGRALVGPWKRLCFQVVFVWPVASPMGRAWKGQASWGRSSQLWGLPLLGRNYIHMCERQERQRAGWPGCCGHFCVT